MLYMTDNIDLKTDSRIDSRIGSIRILYYNFKNSKNVDIIIHGIININNIPDTHIEIYKEDNVMIDNNIPCYLEKLFNKFNGIDSPMLSMDNQRLINKHNLHTSISVGDIVELSFPELKKELWVCKMVGWKQLT